MNLSRIKELAGIAESSDTFNAADFNLRNKEEEEMVDKILSCNLFQTKGQQMDMVRDYVYFAHDGVSREHSILKMIDNLGEEYDVLDFLGYFFYGVKF